jgi:hypothetical protein
MTIMPRPVKKKRDCWGRLTGMSESGDGGVSWTCADNRVCGLAEIRMLSQSSLVLVCRGTGRLLGYVLHFRDRDILRFCLTVVLAVNGCI